MNKLITSAAVIAISLFLLLNLGVYVRMSGKLDQDGAMYAINQFSRQTKKQPPKIVFLGSSLCKHVFLSLDEAAREKSGIASLGYNLQLISDSYLLIKSYLLGEKRPQQIMLLVGPRDFFDNDAPIIYRTMTFKRVLSMRECAEHLPMYARTPDDALYVIAERFCPLFSRRIGVQNSFSQHCKKICRTVGIDVPMTVPPKTAEQFWNRSLDEYRCRYSGISLDRMADQMKFLSRIFDLCKEHAVAVTVVLLPVSQDNVRLMPPLFMQRFRGRVKAICLRSGVKCIDAAGQLDLPNTCYDDCAHLNKMGGKSVLNLVLADRTKEMPEQPQVEPIASQGARVIY